MSYELLQQLAVIPAFLILLTGLLTLQGTDREKAERRFLLFLFIAGGLMLLAVFVAKLLPIEPFNSIEFQLAPLLTPAMVGVLALILLNAKRLWHLEKQTKTAVFLLGLAQIVLLGLLWDSRMGVLYSVLPGVLVLVAGWAVAGRYNRASVILSLLAVAGLLLVNSIVQTQSATIPTWSRFLIAPLYFATPALAVVMPAYHLTTWLQKSSDARWEWRHSLGQLGPALVVLGTLVFITFWWSVWDQTMDLGIGFLLMPIVGVTAVAAGMVMSIVLKGKQRLAGLLYMAIVPLLLFQLQAYGRSVSYHDITNRRADRIAAALDQFYDREGRYPETLPALTPRDLLTVPQPIILLGEKWCYQGGNDFYRLAAFYQEHWASVITLKLYADAGQPPAGSWPCEEQLAAVKDRHYEGFGEGDIQPPPMPTPLPENEIAFPKTDVKPLLDGARAAAGSWSPDSATFVFGTQSKDGSMALHFLDGSTGEICTVDRRFSWLEVLYNHHLWLPDGRLLYADLNRDLLLLTPCDPVAAVVTAQFPTNIVQIGRTMSDNGRFHLQSDEAYWIGDGRSLAVTPITGVVPPDPTIRDNFSWLPGSETLAISHFNDEGSILYLVSGETGTVESSYPLHHRWGQGSPWIEGLTPKQVLVHRTNGFIVVDFSADPPQETDVLANIFGLDIAYPDEVSTAGSIVNTAAESYYLFVRLNHERDRRVFLYDAENGRVDIFDHPAHTLLLFPDGQLVDLSSLDDDIIFQDEFDIVQVDRPQAPQPHLIFAGHTPRDYPHLSIRYLPESAQIAVASAQGVSLVSFPAGEMVQYWELTGDGFSPYLLAAPDGTSMVAVRDFGGLYWLVP